MGSYERLDGTLAFAVEPAHPANVAIVDLDKAPVDAEGRVQFTGDFCLLQPVDPQRGNGRLLLDVPNREDLPRAPCPCTRTTPARRRRQPARSRPATVP